MKLIKSLLLGTAAGFAATAGVQAADLPIQEGRAGRLRSRLHDRFFHRLRDPRLRCLPEGRRLRSLPVQLRQPQHAFTYVPGVGGYGGARWPRYHQRLRPAGLRLGEDGRPHDDRVRPAPLVLRYAYRPAPGVPRGRRADPFIDKAYIQFGPWSFGKFQSFFDFYADAFNNLGALGSDTSVTGAAYTFNAGNGFFATIALEDRGNVTPLSHSSPPIPALLSPASVQWPRDGLRPQQRWLPRSRRGRAVPV